MTGHTSVNNGFLRSRMMAVLLTGILVGTLDALAAILQFIIPTYRNPVRIFQYIASGVFGKSVAFSGDWFLPIAGLIFHYFIATCWAGLFFLLYPVSQWFGKNRIVGGALYGIVIWVTMNMAILPLSRVQQFPVQLAQVAIGMIILILAVGLPVSFRAHQYYSLHNKTKV